MATTSGPHIAGYGRSTSARLAVGVASFAGVLLTTVAVLQILEGIAAVAKDSIYVTGIDYVYEFDVSAWGWIHLVLGAVALATGIGILAGQTWARLAGVFIAFLGTLANFAFIPYYPVWSIVVIAFWIATIWALCRQLADD
jgi:hypothetical protein